MYLARTLLLPGLLFIISLECSSQQEDLLKTEKKILEYLVKKDSVRLKSMIDKDFIMIQADGYVQHRSEFIHAYDPFGPEYKLVISATGYRPIIKDNMAILSGVATQQWQEGARTMRLKTRYTDTYRRSGKNWILFSSFINDNGEDYFVITDTSGIKTAIQDRYRMLDSSVEKKDLCLHLSLKTNDFTTVDHLGNIGSPKFMRQRSRLLFGLIEDSIESNNTIESVTMVGDTAKVIVHQEFKRKQRAGGKVRYMQTTVRQRESWMLTRDGWKLVFVDRVQPLTRIIDGIKTDPDKPVNWNDPVFKKE